MAYWKVDMRTLVGIIIIVVLSACALVPVESSTSDGICTISDCPEGQSLAQMRHQTEEAAVDNGAARPITVGCTGSGPGHVTCWVDLSSAKRLVCNWAGCNAQGTNCTEWEECHVHDRDPPDMTPPPAPPAEDPTMSTQVAS